MDGARGGLLQDGGAGEGLGDAGGPFGGAGGVDVGALAVDGYGDGHVDDVELVDGLPAEVGEGGFTTRPGRRRGV